MGIHTTDAIVLRQYPYRETSVLVTCLTDRFGKLKGLVKGLRDQTRPRYRSAMEPLTLNRIVFYDTRTSSLHLISQCDLLAPFSALQRELEVTRTAAFCAELADVALEVDDPQPQVFELLRDTLTRLMYAASLPSVRIQFILRLLKLSGFQPQLDECTGCGVHPSLAALGTSQAGGFWSPRHGGLLCQRCLHEDPYAQPLGAEWLDAIEHCTDADHPVDLPAAQMDLMQRRLDEFLRYRLDRALNTMRV